MTYTSAVAITLAELYVMLFAEGVVLTYLKPNLEYMNEGRQVVFVVLSMGLVLYIGYGRLMRRFSRC